MASPGARRKVSLIGYGAIGRFVLKHLTEGGGAPEVRVAGVLVRPERRAEVAARHCHINFVWSEKGALHPLYVPKYSG